MLKKTLSVISVSILASALLLAPTLSYAASITINVSQNNIGGLNVPIGGSNVQVGEFDVESSDDVWFFQVRVLCVDAKSFKAMRVKYNGSTIASAAAKESLSSNGGLEANMYPTRFKIEKNKTYTFTVTADISNDAPDHTTACTIESADRLKFKDMDDNNIISSRVNGNFGVSEGTYPIYVESAETVTQKQEATKNNSSNSSSSSNSESAVPSAAEKPPLPSAVFEDEVLTGFEAYKNPFPDTSTDNLVGKSAAELYRRHVIAGFPDGEFKGEEPVNRAQLAKILLVARYNAVEELENNGTFSDIANGAWYTSAVMDAASKSIVNGYPDGTFKPAETVNTVEFLKMITTAFNIELNIPHTYTDVSGEEWFAPYAGAAQKYNMFPDRAVGTLEIGKKLTRDEVAVAIYQYLSNREL